MVHMTQSWGGDLRANLLIIYIPCQLLEAMTKSKNREMITKSQVKARGGHERGKVLIRGGDTRCISED